MKKEKQVIKIFSVISVFIVSLFHFSCNNSDSTFIELLYTMAEIEEGSREEVIQSWLTKHEEFPLIENDKVYYIYQKKEDTQVFLTGDMNKWSPNRDQFMRIVGTSYYYIEQSYPSDARVEYKFIVDGKYILDPFNKKTSAGGFGSNSLLLMPAYSFPTEVLSNRFQNYTTFDTITFNSKIMPKRTLFVYKHPKVEADAPLIIFNDGGEYISLALANIVLDNLIEQKRIPASYAIFVNPGNRMKEYWLNDDYLKMLFEELLPELKENYNIGSSSKIFIGGASLGGLISFYALKNYSDLLTGVFGQSPSFWVDSLQIMRELEDVDLSDKKLIYDYGLFEEDSFDPKINNFLKQKTSSLIVNKYSEGHAWGNWKGHLDEVLIYLLNERVED